MSGEKGRVVINSPYVEPSQHLEYRGEGHFEVVEGRRPAGFWVEIEKRGGIVREFKAIPRVDDIRRKVKEWRDAGYPESTNVTRELLTHWHDRTVRQDTPFFWCQTEAIETLIFLAETKAGHATLIPDDGSEFQRICTKLCTGGGKTIVMSMLIAWQVCNCATYPGLSELYTRNVLVVAPNITVRDRLRVLKPNEAGNYYDRFSIVPENMRGILNQARVEIHNWHVLEDSSKEDPAKNKSVVKKPPRGDDSYCREFAGDMHNVIVINDEAHHAYRIKPEDRKAKTQEDKENQREATIWVEGLDRLHSARKIRTCYDFTATPFIPGRGRNEEEGLFSWIVSDFSLDDGIEAGIVKTPCIVVRDNAPPDIRTAKSKLYHIYGDGTVKNDLCKNSEPQASLPDLVRNAYELLGQDWRETFKAWKDADSPVPPVMITVANNTNTAARIEHAFNGGSIDIPELSGENFVLRIDSERLKKESASRAEELREMSDTVGQEGKPGGNLRNIISVGMLSEGWDARNVTQIMGLRAFTSQLLCEQVVGRGLRRSSYEAVGEGELFPPEYVNVFGIPFSYLLTEEFEPGNRPPRTPATEVKVLPERREYAITWPEVESIRYVMSQNLSLDASVIPEIVLDASSTRISAELAPVVDGRENLDEMNNIDLEKIYSRVRMQRIIFRAASKVFTMMQQEGKHEWQNGSARFHLLGEVVRLAEEYLSCGNIRVRPERFVTDSRRKRLLLCFNMERIITHMWQGIRSHNSEAVLPIFPQGRSTRSTGEMRTWTTSRPHHITQKSHINICTFDSTWEASAAYQLDHNPNVQAWAKNDHLGFCVRYFYGGISRRYLPDFLVRLTNGKMLVLEVKGIETDESRAKHEALCEWVKAVNTVKTFGEWSCDVSYNPADIDGIITGKI